MFSFPMDPNAAYAMDNPPVVRVVVQVTYPPAIRLATADGVADLQESLPSSFTLRPQQPSAGFHISIGTLAGAAPPAIGFFENEAGYELAVNQDWLALSIDQRYTDRSAFAAVLEPILGVVAKVGRLKERYRLGVRYINAAPATIEQFCAWFKPEYLGWAGKAFVARTVQNRTWVLITQLVRDNDDSPVTHGIVRYGFLEGGVGVDITKSSAGTAPSFIADIDFGNQRTGPFDPTAITEQFRMINHEIAAFFENSMTPEGISHFALRRKETE